MISELREKTGAGLLDVKKALDEAKAAASGVNGAGEVDLDKVAIPANLKGLVEEEKPVVKKRTARTGAKKSAVTTDEV